MLSPRCWRCWQGPPPNPSTRTVGTSYVGPVTLQRTLARAGSVKPHTELVAEEITAEVFARVLPKWRRGDVSDPVLYLRRAVINEVRSRHRRRVNERHALARHASRQARIEQGPPTVALSQPLLVAMQQLSVRHRAVVVLRFHDDLSEAEVAQILGSPIGTIKAQTSRALAALRELMPRDPPRRRGRTRCHRDHRWRRMGAERPQRCNDPGQPTRCHARGPCSICDRQPNRRIPDYQLARPTRARCQRQLRHE